MPKISQLPAATTLANTDILLADSYGGTNTRKIAYGDLKAGIQEDSMSVFALKGETATDTQVANSVNAWLNSHVTPTGSTVVIDDTLTVQGAAADAKAAGVARGKIPVITVGSSSTATAFVATLDGVTSLTEGLSFYLYNNKTYNNFATTDSIAATEWSSPVALTESSLDTYNTAIVYLYQRATSTPSKPSSSLTYTFSSGALSGTLGNWSQTIPTGSNTLYVTAATAYSRSTTDSIAAAEWTAPAVVVQNTATGATGINIASVFLYQRASSAPSKPSSSLTYTFSSGALSGTLGSWSQTIPAATGQTCYETHATAILPGQQTTLNLNSLGAKPMFTRDGRLIPLRSFLVGDTVLVTYSTKFVDSGCWIVDLLPAIMNGGGYSSVYVRNDSMDPVSIGRCSFAGGVATATGGMSFAYGTYNTSGGLTITSAEAANAFAFGLGSHALANGAVVFGQGNTATGGVSFTVGSYNEAKSQRGFVAGNHIISSENAYAQAVFGNANVEDVEGKYAFIVGNGHVETGSGTGLHPEIYEPSNALALDYTGNLELAGGISLGQAGRFAIGDTYINEYGLSGLATEYNVATPYSIMELGTIDASGAAASSTTTIRSKSFMLLKAGCEIRAVKSSINVSVAVYSEDNASSYVETVALTVNDSYVAQNDVYVKLVIKYSNNSAISAGETSINAVLTGVAVVHKSSMAKSFTDRFEFGGVSSILSEGILDNADDYLKHRSEYLYDISGSKYFGVTFDIDDIGWISKVNIYLYPDDFSSLDVVGSVPKNGLLNVSTEVGSNHKYAKIEVLHTSETKDFHDATIFADKRIEKVPHPSVGNSSSYDAIPFNYRVFGNVMTSGRLLLPPNYSMTGNKVPLIVFVHGSTQMTLWSDKLDPIYIEYIRYLANEGFAVFDCYPWTNKVPYNDTVWSPFQMPINERAYIEGIKYVGSHFNVDINNTSLLCKSQGGNIGHWAYMQTEFPFRAVGLFAPTCDPVTSSGSMWYGSAMRTFLFNYIDFQGTTTEKNAFKSSGVPTNESVASFLQKNKGKIVSMMPHALGLRGAVSTDELLAGGTGLMQVAPQWMIDEGIPAWQEGTDYIPAFAEHSDYSKTAQCPTKFWCAFDDGSTSSYGNYAIHRYLENGGSDSEFRILPMGTGGHQATDTSESALKSSGSTALGIQYTNIPTAWVEFVEFVNRYVR